MHEVRAGKIIASAVLTGAGCICITLGEGQHADSGLVTGLGLVIVGIVLLIRNWTRMREPC